MAIVGEFPGMSNTKPLFRTPVNPLDKSTVVSIFPKHIKEIKPTLEPSRWEIPPGSLENPSSIIVGPSSWWKDVGEEQPLLEIPVSSVQIAESIVNDYCNGYLGCDMIDAMPGLFYLPGAIHPTELKSPKHKTLFERAYTRQQNWYSVQVKLADAFWARTNGNPLAISDDMRLAARELGLRDKDWMKDTERVAMERCPACGTFTNPGFPVCSNCHVVINKEQAAKLGLVFVKDMK